MRFRARCRHPLAAIVALAVMSTGSAAALSMASSTGSATVSATGLPTASGAGLSTISQEAQEFRPSALAVLPGGDLLILEPESGLRVLRSGADDLEPFAALDHESVAMDLTTVALAEGDTRILMTVWVSELTRAGENNFARVIEYSLDGAELRRWDLALNAPIIGVVVDPGSLTAYLASSWTSEIYTLDVGPEANGTAERWVTLSDVTVVGPLAIDPEGRRLYVSDVAAGTLFRVDLDEQVYPEPTLITDTLGETSAMVFEPAERRLYIADPSWRQIWVLSEDQEASGTEPEVFAAPEEFYEPRGLAIEPGVRAWVGDPGAGALFELSMTGEIVREIR